MQVQGVQHAKCCPWIVDMLLKQTEFWPQRCMKCPRHSSSRKKPMCLSLWLKVAHWARMRRAACKASILDSCWRFLVSKGVSVVWNGFYLKFYRGQSLRTEWIYIYICKLGSWVYSRRHTPELYNHQRLRPIDRHFKNSKRHARGTDSRARWTDGPTRGAERPSNCRLCAQGLPYGFNCQHSLMVQTYALM